MNAIECAFVGRLARDPELKTSQAGKLYCRVSVGVGEGDSLQWVSVTAFGEQAERLVSGAAKGRPVYFEGRLRLSTWNGADGQPRTGLDVAAFRVELLAMIGKRRLSKTVTPTPKRRAATVTRTASAGRPNDFHNDEIPF